MIEHLELQLAALWRLAAKTGREAEITDHVKRHQRIVRQKPEIGELALAIANLEESIAQHQRNQARGEAAMKPEEYGAAVDTMVEVAERHDKEILDGQREGTAGSEPAAAIGAGERGAGEGAGAAAGSSPPG